MTNQVKMFSLISFLLLNIININAQEVPDPNQGIRAEWMRGTYGLNWKPEGTANGHGETLYIDSFLEQIKGLRALDYIQLHLGESFTTSSVHLGPHDLLESFWEGDTDADGSPVNLIVPRAISGRDPFLDMLNSVKSAGLKTQVYVNGSNLLLRRRVRNDEVFILDNPDEIPNITERWMNWCDTNLEAQAFINSQPYHTDVDWPERQYMFCYAEFVLKDYAIRYGNLVDAWIFDSGKMMYLYNGDDRSSGELDDQRIYQAFADAVHAGNTNAAVSFNNSHGSDDLVSNPWSAATLFDDYMFGHPFYSGQDVASHPENLFTLDWSAERNGYIHTNDPNETRTWDDKVVGHYDPPLSKTSWNGGLEATFTNEDFVYWYSRIITNGGAITPGLPLESQVNWNNLFAKEYAMTQLELLDAYLMEYQSPEKANWSRQETILPEAYPGVEYSHLLELGVDFWDPEGDPITSLYAVSSGNDVPSWLKIEKSGDNFKLTGTATDTEPKEYYFRLRIKNDAGLTTRWVTLNVGQKESTQYSTVQIKAAPNTNYGISEIATMTSELQTAPDGIATYQIELQVTPPMDKAIISGASGGDATDYSWGIGEATTTNDQIFNGDENDSIESISNVIVKNFQSNGSNLVVSEILFNSVTIANAHSLNDAVKFDFHNGIIKNVSNIVDKAETILLGVENIIPKVTNFSFGIGNQNVSDQSKNKWSIEGINVKVSFLEKEVTLDINEITKKHESDYIISPNPFLDTINVKAINLNQETGTIQLVTINGNIVVEKSTSGNEATIDNLDKLANGMYLLQIFNTQEQIVKIIKLIKE